MVRAMDLAMAVGAAPVKVAALGSRIRSPVGTYVTLVAEPRHTFDKQPVIDGPVGLMAVRAILQHRCMLMKVGPPSLGMAGITVLVDACLLEHSRIRRSVRVMTVAAGNLSFPLRHMGRAHELRFPLLMALPANLCLGALIEKNGLISDLRELVLVARLLHKGVTASASQATTSMRASLPVGLHPSLMALEAAFVLRFGCLAGVLPEGNQPAYALSPTSRHVVAPRAMTGLAGLLLLIVASVEEKDLPHHGLGEFLKLRGVTGLADLVSCIGGLLSGLSLCGPNRMGEEKKERRSYHGHNCVSHIIIPPLLLADVGQKTVEQA